MAAQRFFAYLAKQHSLCFEHLDNQFELYIKERFENSKYDFSYEFENYLRRFQIKEVDYNTVHLFLNELKRDHSSNEKFSDLQLAAKKNERMLFVLEHNARINNFIIYSMCGIILGISYFALKKSPKY